MKKHGILNSEIDKVLADLGHTDQIAIADLGLPFPNETRKIDLALRPGIPSFSDILELMAEEMKIERIILAEEIKEKNPQQLEKIKELLPDISIAFVSHEDFKKQTHFSKAVIRTGEATPYSNVILQSGVLF